MKQPLFKNVTKYTEKNYHQFVKFHSDKYNLSRTFYTVLMVILILYCVILSIIQKNLGLCALFVLILFAFLIMRIYIPNKKYVKTTNKFKGDKFATFTFCFYNNYFTLGKDKIYYFQLHKVFETKDYFYLYTDDDNAALVSKNGFKIGTSGEFSDFIKKKCLLKYKKQD